MVKVKVYPDDIWDYFLDCQISSCNSVFDEIAYNREYGVSVYLGETEVGYPEFSVFDDGDEIFYEEARTPEECADILEMIYDTYLPDGKIIDCYESKYEEEEVISRREDTLYAATHNFFAEVLDLALPDSQDFDNVIEDCMNHFLEYMARKHNLDIYRPMYLEDENGKVSFEEYPYPQLAFEDENNPIYT